MSTWKLVSFWGSLRDDDPSFPDAAFHAGHLNDILRLNIAPLFPILVASHTSGVWLANELGGVAIPLSWDWDFPNLNCLSPGVHGDQHIYAAGAALFETDTTSAFPLFNWQPIPVLVSTPAGPLTPGQIHRVLVVKALGKLVLVSDNGVFWADIPAAGSAYVFQKAQGLPGSRFSGLAEGLQHGQVKVVVGAWGTDLGKHFGIFNGDWNNPSGDLIFQQAVITGSISALKMLRTDIAACANDRTRLYAVCGGGGIDRGTLTPQIDNSGNLQIDEFGNVSWNFDTGVDFIYRVLVSGDGGARWKPTDNRIIGSNDKLFGGSKDVMGQIINGSYNLCVGVSPFDPKLVAVGAGTFAISQDGGNNWHLANDSSPHYHADIHALNFDHIGGFDFVPRLFICSDGGLASTMDLGKTYTTGANRQLPNFQFRRFAASFVNSGLIGGSLQDNGNAYTMLYVNPDPWKDLDGGDGNLMMFLESGALVRNNNTLTKNVAGNNIEYGAKTRIAMWDDKRREFKDLKLFPNVPLSWGVIPVDATGDGLSNFNPDYLNIIEVVDVLDFKNSAGRPMLAVAAEAETVFGLFGDGAGGAVWNKLADVPHKPDKDSLGKELPYSATAVASFDGNAIFVGMNNGRIFRLDAPAFTPTDLTTPLNTTKVVRFAVSPPSIFFIAGKQIFHFNGTKWTDVTTMVPPPKSEFSALTTCPGFPRQVLFLASNEQVWVSTNDAPFTSGGIFWGDITDGLPRSPHIQDLRFVTESSGASFLYLSTFGWSVFRRLIFPDDTTKSVTITGHMDIVDRKVFPIPDIEAHPSIFNVLQFGPFHPFEEVEYTEDDGDEVRVVLKLRLEWNIDLSVNVKFDALLIALDEDNFVDDQQSGSFKVPFSSTKTQVIDLASKEFWPDRAHIEIKVANP